MRRPFGEASSMNGLRDVLRDWEAVIGLEVHCSALRRIRIPARCASGFPVRYPFPIRLP